MLRGWTHTLVRSRVISDVCQHRSLTASCISQPSSRPALRRFPRNNCASLPREGGAKWDLDPFSLFRLSSSVWNMKPGPFSAKSVPRAPSSSKRQRCSALPRFHSAFSHFSQIVKGNFYACFYPANHPLHHCVQSSHWRGFGFVSAKSCYWNFFFLFLLTGGGFWNIRNCIVFNESISPAGLLTGMRVGMIVNWAPDCIACILFFLCLCCISASSLSLGCEGTEVLWLVVFFSLHS